MYPGREENGIWWKEDLNRDADAKKKKSASDPWDSEAGMAL